MSVIDDRPAPPTAHLERKRVMDQAVTPLSAAQDRASRVIMGVDAMMTAGAGRGEVSEQVGALRNFVIAGELSLVGFLAA